MSCKFMVRERTPLAWILHGVYVYFSSNSLKRASRILEPFRRRSHVSIWRWVQRLAPIANRFCADRKLVKRILMDETPIQIGSVDGWIWIAFELEHRLFLGFHVSHHCNMWDAYIFLKHLRSKYGRKPIYTDGAPWYPEACRWLRLEHHAYDYEWKKFMERMVQALKDRLECFDDYFPCWRDGCDRKHVENWMVLFVFLHNHVRVHMDIGHPPLIEQQESEALHLLELMTKEVILR